jgi:hypothetical protein
MAVNIQVTMSTKSWKIWEIIVWGLLVVLVIATVVSNWFMPRGNFIDTGEVNCPENGGQCHEEYYEDTRNLDIPSWAKHLRNDGFLFPTIGLGALGAYTTTQRKRQQDEDEQKANHS